MLARFSRKSSRSLHLGPKYFLWDLPGYFFDRMTLHLPLNDFRVFLNPVREFRQRIYRHFELPPGYHEALRLLAATEIRLTMPRERLEAMIGAWWATADVHGQVIECGSFRGATALLVALLGKMNGLEQSMLLLDTFSGIPEVMTYDKSRARGEFLPSIDQANMIQRQASALGIEERIEVHQGLFSETFAVLEKQDLIFSFVHIDANIYSGTRDACQFTIPRTSLLAGLLYSMTTMESVTWERGWPSTNILLSVMANLCHWRDRPCSMENEQFRSLASSPARTIHLVKPKQQLKGSTHRDTVSVETPVLAAALTPSRKGRAFELRRKITTAPMR